MTDDDTDTSEVQEDLWADGGTDDEKYDAPDESSRRTYEYDEETGNYVVTDDRIIRWDALNQRLNGAGDALRRAAHWTYDALQEAGRVVESGARTFFSYALKAIGFLIASFITYVVMKKIFSLIGAAPTRRADESDEFEVEVVDTDDDKDDVASRGVITEPSADGDGEEVVLQWDSDGIYHDSTILGDDEPLPVNPDMEPDETDNLSDDPLFDKDLDEMTTADELPELDDDEVEMTTTKVRD